MILAGMAHKRIAILWTIVIVFISQLFHCAYTSQGAKQGRPASSLPIQLQQHVHRYPAQYTDQPGNEARETYEELLSSSTTAAQQDSDEPDLTNQQSARERCRELISLTLLTFRDLTPDERATEEIDCANLQERIREAHRSRGAQQHAQSEPSDQEASVTQQPLDNQFPLTPVYSQRSSVRQNTRQQQFAAANLSAAASQLQALGWPPRGGQMQQLLAVQQRNRQLQQLYQTTTTASPTTFEPLFETTLAPTTTTTTTTTTPRPAQPRIRVAGGPKRRQPKFRSTSTTTTTTTTTTPKPAEPEYEPEGSAPGESSADYTEYYDEQTTTTTTTTTQRPNNRAGGGRRKPRRRGSSTTPKPSTTSTTLSPGYQPRPDGRIIDYMADPNFPRELKGADLTNYPFYISVPEKIDFECKGRHDGYYTNIDLHCQIYHHCAVGNRYDFLCPNYTLFDQTTFTCRFINTVDCTNSAKHFDRNNALYVEKDESAKSAAGDAGSTSTTTTTTSTTQQPKINIQLASNRNTNRELTVSALSIVQQARSATDKNQAPR